MFKTPLWAVCDGMMLLLPSVDADEMNTAATNGDLPEVKCLLAASAKVTAADKTGLQSIQYVARNGHAEVIKLLLAEGNH